MDELGIPADQQQLFYEDKMLKDDHTVNYFHIQKESILHLTLRQRVQLFVKTPTGNAVITLDVVPEDTIQTVKSKITDEIGIPVDQYELTFDEKRLKDDHTLNYYNIRRNSTVHLALRKRDRHYMRLLVKTPTENTVITLDVVPEDTIQTVKTKIMDEVGIPVDQYELTFDEKKLEESHTLNDYNIRSDSTLHLALKRRGDHMHLFVVTETEKTVIKLDVVSKDFLQSVSRKIMDEIGIPIEQQQLTFAGTKLQRGYTLKDYNIRSGSTLHLNLKYTGREALQIFKVRDQEQELFHFRRKEMVGEGSLFDPPTFADSV